MTFLIAFYIIVNVIDYMQNLCGLPGVFVINTPKILFLFHRYSCSSARRGEKALQIHVNDYMRRSEF